MSEPVIVKLKNVRLSFPELFEARAFEGSKPAFSAVYLLDKETNKADIAAMKEGIAKVVKAELKGKTPPKTCLRDGGEKPDVDGYGEDVMFVSARSEKKSFFVVDRNLEQLTPESGRPYAGCYVNAVVRLWAQDNQYGKRVNASLGNIQFVKDGDPFGEKTRSPEQDFTAVEDENLT
jgi:hypothetical protein